MPRSFARRVDLPFFLLLSVVGAAGALSLAMPACSSSDSAAAVFDAAAAADDDASSGTALAPPASVRSCGRSNTTPAVTTVQLVVPSYRNVQLGQAVDGQGNLRSGLEEVGEPYTFGGFQGGSELGVANFPSDLLPQNQGGDHSLEIIEDGGESVLAAVTDAFAPAATRMVHGGGLTSVAPPYSLGDSSVVDGAPDANFVYQIAPEQYAVYALRLDFPDSCAVGALSDLLQGSDPTTIDQRALFLNAAEPRVSALLVRENVQASVVFVANKHRAAVEALFPNGTTSCSVGNFAACAALDQTIAAAINSDEDSDGGEPALSPVQDGTDPLWSATSYVTATGF